MSVSDLGAGAALPDLAALLAAGERAACCAAIYEQPAVRWLLGDDGALAANELAGYRLFKKHGCSGCHQGRNVGGNLFQRFGVMEAYFAGKTPSKADLGRFNVTGRDEDRHVFKVPSLRNVARTAPYFHDASAASLEEAVRLMGRHQLGMELPDSDVTQIVAFLRTLDSERTP